VEKREQRRQLKLVVRQLHAAAKTAASEWEPASTGLVLRTGSGYGQIALQIGNYGDPLHCWIFAGSASRYLLRTYNQRDPGRAPDQRMRAVHSQILWMDPFAYTEVEAAPPRPFELPISTNPGSRHFEHRRTPERTLSPDTARLWLSDMLTTVAPLVQTTSTDEGLLEWLWQDDLDAGDARRSPQGLRYGAMLTKHLGRDTAPWVQRAQIRSEREDIWLTEQGMPPSSGRDRSTRRPDLWSHQRFLRFLEAL
jgi:hypothetical protein